MASSEKERPESCTPVYILQNLEVIKKESDRLDYITDTLERCSIASPSKKKRKMSGYNCFVRVSVKKGQPFKEVIKSRAWSQLEPKSKEAWSHLAEEGCPPRLWKD
jgi:hypothetical protein